MRRLVFPLSLLLISACAATTPPSPQTPAPAQSTPVEQAAPVRSTNALTPVASMPRTIAEPRIRVGLLSDQSTVSFPRTADGYYLVTDKGPSLLKRGFTATAPLANAPVRYAVQVSAISDQSSAQALVEKIRSETGLRVDTVFDVDSDPLYGTFVRRVAHTLDQGFRGLPGLSDLEAAMRIIWRAYDIAKEGRQDG